METQRLNDIRAALGGRYEIERELGHGGMATVYLAREVKHDRRVAVKILHPDYATAVGAKRFEREIEIVARLQHPHILPLLDSGIAAGSLFFVMPFVEGLSLERRLSRHQQLPVEEALRLGREIAAALAYAHRHFLVHLDIKPGNILLSDGHAVVADFGIARPICQDCSDAAASAGIVAGTPDYMSPEQAMGVEELDGRSDIYSLGCVLFEMLTGTRPFVAATADGVLFKQLHADPPSVRELRSEVPASIDALIRRMLAKEPRFRVAKAGEVAAALATESSTVFDDIPVARAGSGRTRARVVASLAAVAGFVAAVSAAATGGGYERQSPDVAPVQPALMAPVDEATEPLEPGPTTPKHC